MQQEATRFAMELLNRLPQEDRLTLEAHMTAVLIVFWAALWGTFGTDYAEGFICAQLDSMSPDKPHDVFRPPSLQ